jgi:alkanesulfonate monooxygenase SsuD/methylene tetrahydromethanopterin reductase-like flavin-dependent oxidoreductase (luciferase family)
VEAMVSLAAIAAQVPDIRLGTLLTSATFRHPGLLAIQAANIDEISGGRLELGLGAGWFEAEHLAYGLPFGASFGERFDRLAEQLEILTGLWATPAGGTFDYAGAYYQLAGAPGLPKPLQRAGDGTPRVPLVLGGHGPRRTPALAARFADEFNVGFAAPAVTGAQIARVRAACEAIGRNPADITYSAVQLACLGADPATLTRRLAATGRRPQEYQDDGLAGSASHILDQLAAFARVGVSRMYLQILDLADLDHLAELGQLNGPAAGL